MNKLLSKLPIINLLKPGSPSHEPDSAVNPKNKKRSKQIELFLTNNPYNKSISFQRSMNFEQEEE